MVDLKELPGMIIPDAELGMHVESTSSRLNFPSNDCPDPSKDEHRVVNFA